MKTLHERIRFALTGPKRDVEVLHMKGKFTFRFRKSKKAWTSLTVSSEAAWCVYQGIEAMHENVCGSSSKLWHDIRTQRKSIGEQE